MTHVAIAVALLAGLLFAFTVHLQKKGLDHADGLVATLISVGTMAGFFWLLSPFFVDWSWWLSEAVWIFAACGLIFPGLGQRLSVASVTRVGPSLTAVFGAFAPVFATIPAVLILGERFNLQAALGLSMTIGAFVLASVGGRGLRLGQSAFVLLLPLGASLVRGVVQPAAKIGYTEVNSAFFSTLVMATVSTAVLSIAVLARRFYRGSAGRSVPMAAYLWFGLAGLFIGSGIFLWQVALTHGEVVVVAPLVSTTPLWAVALGVFVFRHEKLGWRHIAVAVLVVAGTILITTR